MKKLIWLLPFVVVLICTGCPSPANPPSPTACNRGELRFDAPVFVLATKYASPVQIYNNGGLSASLAPLTWLSGSGFGWSEIQANPPHPFGTQQIIRMNNTVLNFDLKQGTQTAQFEYLDQGGTINLGAHGGVNRYVGSMYQMPASMTINGVSIKKSNVKDILNPQGVKVAETGTITLQFSPDIGGMLIGGQEMYLDNFCFN